jgi:hypothetical protein
MSMRQQFANPIFSLLANKFPKRFNSLFELRILGSIHFLAGGVGRRNLGVGQPILTCFTGVGLFIVLV